jgi:hypothetical protein
MSVCVGIISGVKNLLFILILNSHFKTGINMFKKINYKILLPAIFINALLCAASYFGAFAHSDGGEGIIIEILYLLFYVFAFPLFLLLMKLDIMHFASSVTALTVDVLFYSFLIERLVRNFKKKTAV